MIAAVTGGKGGTGKSFVATNLAVLLARSHSLVLADLDVEAPNDHILLGAELEGEEAVKIMFPFIRYEKCIRCRACVNVCDTGAMLASKEGLPYVIPRLCSGCKSCLFACPTEAIVAGERVIGRTYVTPVSVNGSSFTLVTGVLKEGEEHTPPVVLAARRRALSLDAELHLVDTAAGTSNTVSTAMYGAKAAVAVTEPTPLGLHDLRLILHVLKELEVPRRYVVINRAGIGPAEKHYRVAEEMGAKVVVEIPYSREVVESYVKGIPIVASNPASEASEALRTVAEALEEAM